MIGTDRTLTVGTGARSIIIRLTETAARMLDDLPGASAEGLLDDHRSLLTTIVVGRVAAGHIGNTAMLIDGADIVDAVEHSGQQLTGNIVASPRMTR